MESFPIDFVVIWVDGNDPEWRKEKARYSGELTSGDDVRDCRYRDWDNLRYWFRGVEKYSPWVNKVYFITCGQVPEWLNLSAEKLCFVKHSDYMPEEYLPTFSSHPIELNLHRIKGLQEHFVYFNDDMFLTQPVTPDFFFRDGLPVLYGSLVPLTAKDDGAYPYILLNDIMLINRHFSPRMIDKSARKKLNEAVGIKLKIKNDVLLSYKYFSGFQDDHLPVSIRKSTMEKLWEIERDILDETSRHRFRDLRDVNQYVFRYWQYASGQFIPAKKTSRGRKYNLLPDKYSNACQSVINQSYPMICLNDVADTFTQEQFEEAKQALIDAFSRILPEKSSFEK